MSTDGDVIVITRSATGGGQLGYGGVFKRLADS